MAMVSGFRVLRLRLLDKHPFRVLFIAFHSLIASQELFFAKIGDPVAIREGNNEYNSRSTRQRQARKSFYRIHRACVRNANSTNTH